MIDIDTMSNTTMPMWRPGDWRPGPVLSTATETLLLSLGVTTFYRKGTLIYYVILSCTGCTTQTTRASNEGYPKFREDFTITEKAPTRAFSWLKAPTSAFPYKTLLRRYAKLTLTHGS